MTLSHAAAFACALLAFAGCLAQPAPSLDAAAPADAPAGPSLAATGPEASPDDVALGVRFEPNLGQEESPASFLGFAGDSRWAFGAGWAVAAHRAADGLAQLRMEFPGASAVVPEGLQPGTGVTNYVRGNDPAAWLIGVPHWESVAYPSLYDGVDLVFRGSGASMEYDFVVAPGADPSAIRVRLAGADDLFLSSEGDLVAVLEGTEVRHARPVAYQDTPLGRQAVDAAFRLDGPVAAFELGAYDPTLPLVIDPLVVVYSTYVGGIAMDVVNDVDVGPTGDLYGVGTTFSPGLPVTVGPIFAPPSDAFVARIMPAGGGLADLVYLTYLGGPGSEEGNGIGVDGMDFAYVTGWTDSPFFPLVAPTQPVFGGVMDAFLTYLDPTGVPVFSTYHGGVDPDIGYALDFVPGTDPFGMGTKLWLTGMTSSAGTFPIVGPAFQPVYGGGASDAFVAVYTGIPVTLVFSSYLGGAMQDEGYGVAVAATPTVDAYFTGVTASAGTFPVLPGAVQPVFGGPPTDAYLVRMPMAGGPLTYASYLGGVAMDIGEGVAWAPAPNDVHVVGTTQSVNFPATPGAFQPVLSGLQDAFVARISPDGLGVLDNACTTFLGGPGDERGQEVASDMPGSAYVTGVTTSAIGFPLSAGAFQLLYGGGGDAFVTSLTMLCGGLADLAYSSYLGGPLGDIGLGTALGPAGEQAVGGGADVLFPTTPTSFQPVNAGMQDGFLTTVACVAPPPC